MYGAETWAIKETEEKKMDVAEMRMFRWMCGVTRRDKIRNEVIRGTSGVRKLSDKTQESRLRWYGHVMRRDEQYIGRRVMEMEPISISEDSLPTPPPPPLPIPLTLSPAAGK
ncbi:uncharacterized protein [Palaemon carinicauda]|uniref:uncharacterized protein n=1 Tax=Palaemon carinicauda TaxID=392227 RepID=UPI0035B61703